MARLLEHRLMPCALVAQAFWQRSIAPFRWQVRTLSRYPWPMQRSPRFVFALPAMRWVTMGMTKEGRRSTVHRCLHAASARFALRRSMPFAAKSASSGAATRQPLRARPLAINGAPSMPATERKTPLRRRTPQPMRFVDRRIRLYRQRSAHPSVRPAARGESTAGRTWAATHRVAAARKPRTYSVSEKARAIRAFVAPRHRASAMHGLRSRPTPLDAVNLAAKAAHANRIRMNRPHVGAARPRPSTAGHSGYRSNRSPSVGARRDDSRQSPRRLSDDREQARGRSDRMRYRSVLERFRTVSRERVLTFSEAVAFPRYREQAVARVRGFVHIASTKQAGVSHPARRPGGSPVRASARHFIRRGSSPRVSQFLVAPLQASQHTRDVSLTRAIESVAKPVRLIHRHRAETGTVREASTLRVPNRSLDDTRGEGRGSYPSEWTGTHSQRPPAVEEVRRILIPLIQQALFSTGTMGRLTDGVISGVERRDGAERYRKSGGR